MLIYGLNDAETEPFAAAVPAVTAAGTEVAAGALAPVVVLVFAAVVLFATEDVEAVALLVAPVPGMLITLPVYM